MPKKPPPSRVELVGIDADVDAYVDADGSSADIEMILSIGKSRKMNSQKLPSRGTGSGLKTQLQRSPAVEVETILDDLSSIATILVKGDGSTMEKIESADLSFESDIEDFMDYAKDIVGYNNTSYDSQSFRDFESAIAESVRSHFLDDSGDQDSMTSASSFSGYDHDDNKSFLDENSLISDASYLRRKGKIATKKANSTFWMSSLFDFGADSPRSRKTTPEPKSVSIAEDDYHQEDEQSANPESQPVNESFASTVETGTTCSVSRSARQSVRTLISDDGSDYYTVGTVDTTPTFSVPQDIERKRYSTEYLKKFDINLEENSVISTTSFKPRPRRKKRRFRMKGTKRDEINTSIRSQDNVEQTLDELAFIMAREKHRDGRLSKALAANNNNIILARIKQASPGFYNAALKRMGQRDQSCVSPVPEGEQSYGSHSETNESEQSLPLHRSPRFGTSIRMSIKTPDKTYEADKSQQESTLDEDQAVSRDDPYTSSPSPERSGLEEEVFSGLSADLSRSDIPLHRSPRLKTSVRMSIKPPDRTDEADRSQQESTLDEYQAVSRDDPYTSSPSPEHSGLCPDLSLSNIPLHRSPRLETSIRMSIKTPDRTYEADKNQQESTLDKYQAVSRDDPYTSSSPPEHSGLSPDLSRSDIPLHRSPRLETSIRMSIKTPDRTYERDKSQQESTLDECQAVSRDDPYTSSPSPQRSGLEEEVFSGLSPDLSRSARRISPSSSPDTGRHVFKEGYRETCSALDQDYMGYMEEIPDDDSSDHLPEISVDSASCLYLSIDEGLGTIMVPKESSDLVDGWDLDETIEIFLAGKIDRLKRRTQERQVVQERKYRVLEEIRKRQQYQYVSYSEVYTSLLSRNSQAWQGPSTSSHKGLNRPISSQGSSESPGYRSSHPLQRPDSPLVGHEHHENTLSTYNVEKGRALIRRIQYKRKVIAEARQRMRSDPSSFAVVGNERSQSSPLPSQSSREISELNSPEVSDSPLDDIKVHEKELESFLIRRAPSSPLDAKKKSLMNLKVKRKNILKSQFRGRDIGDKLLGPLLESMDASVHGSEETSESIGVSKFSSPPATVIKSLRFGRRRSRSENSYEALQEKDGSFVATEMNSGELLLALAPPSPESPIRDYTLSRFGDTDSSAALASTFDDTTEDEERQPINLSSRSESPSAPNPSNSTRFPTDNKKKQQRSVVFSPEVTAFPADKADDNSCDSFDAILLRHTPRHAFGQEENPSFIVAKVSPTSAMDIFDAHDENPKSHHDSGGTLAFVDDEEADPLFVDEDDWFGGDSFQQDDGTLHDLVEANFISYNRFEV